jgi:toxin YoeB
MSLPVLFTPEAWVDYLWWQQQDRKTLRRINQLIEATRHAPFEGIGKPEALHADLAGFWSRRIDDANRLVCAVEDGRLGVISCRYHY